MNAPDRILQIRLEEGEKKVEYKKDTKIPNAGTFTIKKEDHTIGNLLRMQLLLDPNVAFAGYIQPHPLMHYIDIRVQTTSADHPVIHTLSTAIEDLGTEIDLLERAFEVEVNKLRTDSNDHNF